MSFTPDDYEKIREGTKRSAKAVVPFVMAMLPEKPETVVDVGGGEGWWAREFAVEHNCTCLVLDESATDGPDDEGFWPGEVSYRRAKFDSLDPFVIPIPPAGRFDLAVCLEVAEHIPELYAAQHRYRDRGGILRYRGRPARGSGKPCAPAGDSVTGRKSLYGESGLPAGRFVLLHNGPTGFGRGYVTSWDTWDDAEAAFPIEAGFRLEDGETGRVWHPGSTYEWEAAQT